MMACAKVRAIGSAHDQVWNRRRVARGALARGMWLRLELPDICRSLKWDVLRTLQPVPSIFMTARNVCGRMQKMFGRINAHVVTPARKLAEHFSDGMVHSLRWNDCLKWRHCLLLRGEPAVADILEL